MCLVVAEVVDFRNLTYFHHDGTCIAALRPTCVQSAWIKYSVIECYHVRDNLSVAWITLLL